MNTSNDTAADLVRLGPGHEELVELLRAGVSMIYIETREDTRAIEQLMMATDLLRTAKRGKATNAQGGPASNAIDPVWPVLIWTPRAGLRQHRTWSILDRPQPPEVRVPDPAAGQQRPQIPGLQNMPTPPSTPFAGDSPSPLLNSLHMQPQLWNEPMLDQFVLVMPDLHQMLRQDLGLQMTLQDLRRSSALVASIVTSPGSRDELHRRRLRSIVVVSARPLAVLPDDVRAVFQHVVLPLPNQARRIAAVEYAEESFRYSAAASMRDWQMTPETRGDIARAGAGLTGDDLENATLRLLVRESERLDAVETPQVIIQGVQQLKADRVHGSNGLRYIEPATRPRFDDFVGWDAYSAWVRRRRLIYSDRARSHQIPYPKGVVLLGPPGTGKSEVGQATCDALGLPGFQLDVGAVFASLVGESEARMRAVQEIIESQDGAVLVIDEIDKAFGGATTARGDGGVAQRVFGGFLTYLADKRGPTFVVVTMNRTTGMPPEFLRTGRFDCVWATDLPTAEDRKRIVEVHFRRQGVAPTSLPYTATQWAELTEATEDFVGSELAGVVTEARTVAFERDQDNPLPTFEELLQAVAAISPLAKSAPDELAALRLEAGKGARPVRGDAPPSGGVRTSRRRSVAGAG